MGDGSGGIERSRTIIGPEFGKAGPDDVRDWLDDDTPFPPMVPLWPNAITAGAISEDQLSWSMPFTGCGAPKGAAMVDHVSP